MQEWEVDVPVLMIFFARPKEFEQAFECVRKAKPSTLLLWQDGPREGREDDVKNIQECRKIAENVDWNCTVYRNYNDANIGCDPSTFMAQKWAFSIVDKCIVLEDDFLTEPFFFMYCKELLDRYEGDNRINHICGFNLLGESEDCPNDYLFSYTGSGAWASWKRVVDGWDDTYAFLHDKYAMDNLKKKYGKRRFKLWYNRAVACEKTGKAFWESILGFDCILNNRYAIIPKKNLVSNIGMTENSTHSDTQVKLLEKSQQTIFNNPILNMELPLKHPEYIVPDYQYMEKLDRLMGNGYPILELYRKIVYLIKCIYYGETKRIFNAIKRRMKNKDVI